MASAHLEASQCVLLYFSIVSFLVSLCNVIVVCFDQCDGFGSVVEYCLCLSMIVPPPLMIEVITMQFLQGQFTVREEFAYFALSYRHIFNLFKQSSS